MKSSVAQRASMIAALVIISGFNDHFPSKKMQSRKIKECLQCGMAHDHNNAFCSAECCNLNKQQGESDE